MKKTNNRHKSRAVRNLRFIHKGIVLAADPPIDRDLSHLAPIFKEKLLRVLVSMQQIGKPFKFNEGYRTVDRQQWLYGSGRPRVSPYGREGPIITNADGVKKLSSHQGKGSQGTGLAADCYPINAQGQVYIPDISDGIWRTYADAIIKEGLEAGYDWNSFKDPPHCELPQNVKRQKTIRKIGARARKRRA